MFVRADRPAMSDQQIRDEILILFAAGHETTANALSWTWYLLARSPKIEEKLHKELDSVLGSEPRKLSSDDAAELLFTRKVFTEELRLYPPAWVIARKTTRDVRISGYEIPCGANVVMSQYVIHHDSRYFPRPEKFDPDRWTEEMARNLPKGAYFPFGAGPRSCVGEPFAWMEGILVIAAIASRWRLELFGKKEIEMLPRTTLRPKKGIRMRIAERAFTSSRV